MAAHGAIEMEDLPPGSCNEFAVRSTYGGYGPNVPLGRQERITVDGNKTARIIIRRIGSEPPAGTGMGEGFLI